MGYKRTGERRHLKYGQGYGGDKPTKARLEELLRYSPKTGVFTWRVRAAYRIQIGDVAGTVTSHGYRMIRIDNRAYYAHHLAWLWNYGEWPDFNIDHADRDTLHNSKKNLRRCDQAQNISNSAQKPGRTGYRGVWKTASGGWSAMFGNRGVRRSLGVFDSANAAARAWDRAAIAARGEFARTNFPREDYL